jgi:hypothetical protein
MQGLRHAGGSFFDQFALSHSSGVRGEDSEHQEHPPAERERWIPEELPSKKRVREELGEPDERKSCFGCVYELSADATQLPSQGFKELVLLASKCIGQMSFEALGSEMARIYEKFRRDINRRNRHEDEAPLPPWTASSIIEHLKYHNVDPEVQTLVRLIETQEMIGICCKGIVEVNEKTKQQRINKDALINYERLVKLWYHIASKPLDKQFGYRKNARVDLESVNQPFITKNRKTIVDYYTRRGNE